MGSTHDRDPAPNGQSVELTPEIKTLLDRVEGGHVLNLTQNGIVVATLTRVDPALPSGDLSVTRRQQAALTDLLARLAALPPEPEPADGLSGSIDHDQILYGDGK